MNTQHINKRIPRGDRNVLEWKYKGQLPYSAATYFTVKKTTDPTDDRLIDLLCTTDYDAETDKTTITAIVPANNTADLTSSTYKYDIANYGNNDGEEFTPFSGDLFLIGDVRTPFDGTDLPEDAERYIPVKVSDITDGNFVKRNGNTFDGQDLSTVIGNTHTHENKSLLDSYDQTNANLTDAVNLKHSHANKAVIDQVSQQTLDQNALHTELFDFLLNGNIDEADTNVSIDFNQSLIRIGAL